MISIDQARKAKEKLQKLLNRPTWLRGIGLAMDDEKSYILKVNINKQTDEILKIIPYQIDGVLILIDEVGDIEFT